MAIRVARPSMLSQLMRLLTSTFGLFLINMTYLLLGAWLFLAIEAPREQSLKNNLEEERDTLVDHILSLGMGPDEYYRGNASDKLAIYERQLANFYRKRATFEISSSNDSLSDLKLWSYEGAIIYCYSVITTIGWGNIVPNTINGKLGTVIYGLNGMPLFFSLSSQVGTICSKIIFVVWNSFRNTVRPFFKKNPERGRNQSGSKSMSRSSIDNDGEVGRPLVSTSCSLTAPATAVSTSCSLTAPATADDGPSALLGATSAATFPDRTGFYGNPGCSEDWSLLRRRRNSVYLKNARSCIDYMLYAHYELASGRRPEELPHFRIKTREDALLLCAQFSRMSADQLIKCMQYADFDYVKEVLCRKNKTAIAQGDVFMDRTASVDTKAVLSIERASRDELTSRVWPQEGNDSSGSSCVVNMDVSFLNLSPIVEPHQKTESSRAPTQTINHGQAEPGTLSRCEHRTYSPNQATRYDIRSVKCTRNSRSSEHNCSLYTTETGISRHDFSQQTKTGINRHDFSQQVINIDALADAARRVVKSGRVQTREDAIPWSETARGKQPREAQVEKMCEPAETQSHKLRQRTPLERHQKTRSEKSSYRSCGTFALSKSTADTPRSSLRNVYTQHADIHGRLAASDCTHVRPFGQQHDPGPLEHHQQLPPGPLEHHQQLPPGPLEHHQQLPPGPLGHHQQLPPGPLEHHQQLPPGPLEHHQQLPPGPLEHHQQLPPGPLEHHQQLPPGPLEHHQQLPPGPLKHHQQLPPGPLEHHQQLPPGPPGSEERVSCDRQHTAGHNMAAVTSPESHNMAAVTCPVSNNMAAVMCQEIHKMAAVTCPEIHKMEPVSSEKMTGERSPDTQLDCSMMPGAVTNNRTYPQHQHLATMDRARQCPHIQGARGAAERLRSPGGPTCQQQLVGRRSYTVLPQTPISVLQDDRGWCGLGVVDDVNTDTRPRPQMLLDGHTHTGSRPVRRIIANTTTGRIRASDCQGYSKTMDHFVQPATQGLWPQLAAQTDHISRATHQYRLPMAGPDRSADYLTDDVAESDHFAGTSFSKQVDILHLDKSIKAEQEASSTLHSAVSLWSATVGQSSDSKRTLGRARSCTVSQRKGHMKESHPGKQPARHLTDGMSGPAFYQTGPTCGPPAFYQSGPTRGPPAANSSRPHSQALPSGQHLQPCTGRESLGAAHSRPGMISRFVSAMVAASSRTGQFLMTGLRGQHTRQAGQSPLQQTPAGLPIQSVAKPPFVGVGQRSNRQDGNVNDNQDVENDEDDYDISTVYSSGRMEDIHGDDDDDDNDDDDVEFISGRGFSFVSKERADIEESEEYKTDKKVVWEAAGDKKKKAKKKEDASRIKKAQEEAALRAVQLSAELARMREEEQLARQAERFHVPLFVMYILVIIYVLMGAVVFFLWEKELEFWDSLYFIYVMLSTTGFGDLLPKPNMYAFIVVYGLVGMALYNIMINATLELFMEVLEYLAALGSSSK